MDVARDAFDEVALALAGRFRSAAAGRETYKQAMKYAGFALGTAVLLSACAVDGAASPSMSSRSAPPSSPAMGLATASLPEMPAASPGTTQTPAPILAFTEQQFDGAPVAILAGEGGWVAVGASESGAPTAWTSSDAVKWTAHDVPDPNPQLRERDGFVGSVMGPMAAWGDTLFSFGTVIGCCDGRGVLAWRSTDGKAWEVIESESELFTNGYYVQQLLAHNDGLLARETGFPQYSSRLWFWTPEGSWMASDLGDFGLGGSPVVLTGIAWDGERFVAIGGPLRGDHDAPPTGGIWVSAEGRDWERVKVPAMASTELGSVVAAPGGGFLTIGQDDGVPVARASADGRTWEARPLPEDAGLVASRVFEAGDLLIALGFGADRTAAWISRDGISWDGPAALPPLEVTNVVAGSGNQVVVIGRERTPDGSGRFLLFEASLGG